MLGTCYRTRACVYLHASMRVCVVCVCMRAFLCVSNVEDIRFLFPIILYFVIEMPQSPGIV